MKKFLFTASCLFFVLFSNAQKFTVSYSDAKEVDHLELYTSGNSFYAFGQTDNKMQLAYTFKLSKVRFGIKMSKYDKQLNLLKENRLEQGKRAFGPFMPNMQVINNKVLLFYSKFDKDDDNASDLKLFVSEIDTVNLSLKTTVKVCDIDLKDRGLFKSSSLLNSYQFVTATSPESSKILVLFTTGVDGKFYYNVLDSNLNPLWKKSVSLDDKAKYQSITVDNAGTVFMGYQVVERNGTERTGEVLVCNGGKEKSYHLNFTTGMPATIYVKASNRTSAINVLGTYYDKHAVAGVFQGSFEKTNGRSVKLIQTPFDESLVVQFEKDGWGSTSRRRFGVDNIDFSLHEFDNGDIGMTGEFRRLSTSQSGEVGKLSHSRTFVIAGGILDIRFKKDEVLFSRIPKSRVSAGTSLGDSFDSFTFSNTNIILYNDSEENIERDINKPANRSDKFTNHVLVAATIAEDGTIKREKLLDARDERFLAITNMLKNITSNEILIPLKKEISRGRIGEDLMLATVVVH